MNKSDILYSFGINEMKFIDNKSKYSFLNDENKPQFLNTTYIKQGNNNVPYIGFKPFDELDFVKTGFSTRLGGVSDGIYSTLNLAKNRGDDISKVNTNFNLIAEALDTDISHMVCSKQTHTTNVIKVTNDMCGIGTSKDIPYDDVDGLVTNEPGICLVTSFADCIPVFFADPVAKCIASVHSGWRGTVNNISRNAINIMCSEYGCDINNIHAFIGPGICEDCYEVSADVADEFKSVYDFKEISHILKNGKVKDKFQLNLHMANYYNLANIGIKPSNIGIADLCTCCNPDLLFSHRASKGKRGVLCGFIYIKS